VLHLVIASAYAAKLIGNAAIGRYLQKRHPELVTELSTIVSAASFEQADGG